MDTTPETQTSIEFIEKIVAINRVAKVTKGGKKLSFSALVAVGDGAGKVGIALGKANEVADAIRKGLSLAKKAMFPVAINGTTITHTVVGHYGAAKVLLKPASEGTGVIASGPVRAICDAAGIKDILTKCLKSDNPVNVMKATVEGLQRLKFSKADRSQEE
jgi:small subunit ribosomal protein S5